MNRFITGALYLYDGFKLLAVPGLKRYVIIPLIINLFFFVGFFLLLRHEMALFNLWFVNHLPHWLRWMTTILWLFFFATFIILFLYTFITLANIIAAPFNSLLAEKVEYYLTGNQLAPRSLWESIKNSPRIIARQFAILAYYLPRALVILILFIIPIVHFFAVILWFLFNAWFLSLTYLDYPSDNHEVPLTKVRAWQSKQAWTSFGFGISVFVTSMIPFVNFFTIPAAVAGATKWWVLSEKN